MEITKTYIGKRGKVKNKMFQIILDEKGIELFNKHRWYLSGNEYCGYYLVRHTAVSEGPRKTIFFHKELMGVQEGQICDHINRNRFDNRICNLRLVNHQDNMRNCKFHSNNKSGHRGVVWIKQVKKWRAQIRLNGKHVHLGMFIDFAEACNAYDKKASELFGEYLGEVVNE